LKSYQTQELNEQKISPRRNHTTYDISSVVWVCRMEAIKDFGELKLEWLRKYLPYEYGIPADDTLARVIRRLCPKAFNACFFELTRSISKKTKGDFT